MLEFVTLTEDEKLLVTEGNELHQALIEKLVDVPTLAGPTPRELETRRQGEAMIPVKGIQRFKKTLYSQVFLGQFGKSLKNSEKGERSNGGNWTQASSPRRWLAWQDQDGPGGKRTSYQSGCLLGTSRSERLAPCSPYTLHPHSPA